MKGKTWLDQRFDEVRGALNDGRDPPNASMNSHYAAMWLGISTKTLGRLRKCGIVPAFAVSVGKKGRVSWRYLESDLENFRLYYSPWKRFWDPVTNPELPVKVVAKILGVTPETVHDKKSSGKLADYTPESVRKHLLKNHSRRVAQAEKRRLRSKVSNLRWEITRLRKRLASRDPSTTF